MKASLINELILGNTIIDKDGKLIKKALILFDDIDGLAEADHGSIAYFIELIKIAKHPIVFTTQCNNYSKIKRLCRHC